MLYRKVRLGRSDLPEGHRSPRVVRQHRVTEKKTLVIVLPVNRYQAAVQSLYIDFTFLAATLRAVPNPKGPVRVLISLLPIAPISVVSVHQLVIPSFGRQQNWI